MQDRSVWHTPLRVAAAAAALAGIQACATARVYDSYYSDYHVWNAQEVAYYQRWEAETRRPHCTLVERPPDEEKVYWAWRHDHETRPGGQLRSDGANNG